MAETRPIWDRGDAIDARMLRFTIGDDPIWDRRLVAHDIRGSLAWAAGLARAELLSPADHLALERALTRLLEDFLAGAWTVEADDEDVHSAVDRRLVALEPEAGKRLHTGRSRNEQVTVDLFLWLRDACHEVDGALVDVGNALGDLVERHGRLPLPGYTHLRRAMPSTVADWAGAHARAFAAGRDELAHAARRVRECPLGSGAGYGVPLPIERAFVAQLLGFDGPTEPVTSVQHARGRAELAYLTALEQMALDLGKLVADLWLFSTREFGFMHLSTAFTTGSSLMPHKRNPDVLELLRAQARAIVAERAALLDVLRDLPSGYHRDFQLIKPPLFRAHDRATEFLALLPHLLAALEFDVEALTAAAADPDLRATERALDRARAGVPFRDAYREESRTRAP